MNTIHSLPGRGCWQVPGTSEGRHRARRRPSRRPGRGYNADSEPTLEGGETCGIGRHSLWGSCCGDDGRGGRARRVSLPDQVTVGARRSFNGWDRKKMMIKIYAAGLYLEIGRPTRPPLSVGLDQASRHALPDRMRPSPKWTKPGVRVRANSPTATGHRRRVTTFMGSSGYEDATRSC